MTEAAIPEAAIVEQCPVCGEPFEKKTGKPLNYGRPVEGLPKSEKPCFPCFFTKSMPTPWDVGG